MITLDPASHIYRVDGIVRPSVSEILQASGKVTKFYKGTAARDLGKEAHALLEAWDKGEYVPYEWEHIDPFYLIQWQKVLDGPLAGYKVFSIEKSFYNRQLGYCGTLDREFVNKDTKKAVIVDIKTGSSVPGFTNLQTAAYAMGLYPIAGYDLLERLSVHLNPKNKSYKIKQFDDPTDFLEWERIVKEFHARG